MDLVAMGNAPPTEILYPEQARTGMTGYLGYLGFSKCFWYWRKDEPFAEIMWFP
jgi:hypothetical protein